MNKKVFSIVAILMLVIILTTCFVACNADNYVKKLEKLNYVIISENAKDYDAATWKSMCKNYVFASEGDYIDWFVCGVKLSPDKVFIVKFNNKEAAKRYYDERSKYLEAKDATQLKNNIVISVMVQDYNERMEVFEQLI